MEFDPTKDYGNQANKSKFDDNLPAGEYLLAAKFLIMKVAKKSGKDYARILIEVLEGPAKNATFWQFQSMNLEKEGTQKRLGWGCQAMGIKNPFNPADSSQLAEAMLLRPFKAYVNRKRDQQGQYYNDIARFSLPKAKGEINAEEVHILAEHRDRLSAETPRYKDQRSEADSESQRRQDFETAYGDSPPPPTDDDVIPF